VRELVIISGKGGTGKTSLTASFASLANNAILCDADVDAADLHLLMNPTIQQQTDFQGGNQAEIDKFKCTECGLCIDLCRFDAISPTFEVSPIDCEGCGVCVDFCPEQTINFPVKTCGQWFISDTKCGPMVHARLGIAEENSGKLVALVRQEAKKLAENQNKQLIITDGPPGIGCPVIASMGGATALLVVAEPTVSGIHDMERVIQLAFSFKIPVMICVNKFDLNVDQTEAIITFAKNHDIPFVGKIPFNPIFTKAMIQGKTVLEYDSESDAGLAVKQVWENMIKSPAMNSADHLEFNIEPN